MFQQTSNSLPSQIVWDIPEDVLFALDQPTDVFAREAKLLLAIKLYEVGKLTTGLAAQFAGVPRSAFFHALSEHGISPFGTDVDELESDVANAAAASHHE